ncbi:hypothetical protein AAG570_001021, partial [Ranatra chinensis]
ERQVKFVQDHISSTENNLSNLHQSFGGYVKKIAKLRNKSDEIATAIYSYSEKESINKSVKFCLRELAGILATVGDCREVQIKNLDVRVVREFGQYDTLCHNAKSEVRNICGAKDREHNRRRHLNRTKAEAEVVKATSEVTRMQKALEEHVDIFEKKKLQDVKLILRNFVMEELSYHARAINLFTSAYNCIDKINENTDLEVIVCFSYLYPFFYRNEITNKKISQCKGVHYLVVYRNALFKKLL